jgi:copper(I)-binding protein
LSNEAGGSAYEGLVVHICFSRPSNRRFLARIGASSVVVGRLKIGHPWVREAAEGALGTYSCIIEIQNDGDEPERLLGATIEGAGTGVLYKL